MKQYFHRTVSYINVINPDTGLSHKVNTLVGKFGANPNYCTYTIGVGPYDLNYYHVCKSCGGLLMNISIQRGQNYCCHSCYLSLRNKVAWQDPTYQQQKSEIFKKVITDTRTTSRALCMSAISQMRKQGWDKCYLYEADSQVKDSFKLGISVEPNRRERFGDVIPNIHSLAVGNPETICALEWLLKDTFLDPAICNGTRLNTEVYPALVYEQCIDTIKEVCADPERLIELIRSRKPYEHTSSRYAGFCEKLISVLEASGLKIDLLDNERSFNFSHINYGLSDFINSFHEYKAKKGKVVGVSSQMFPGGMFNSDVVIDDGKYVVIKKFPYAWFLRLVKGRYKTSKILKILETVGVSFSSSIRAVRVHKFFLPEIVYLLSQGNGQRRNQAIINSIVNNTWIKDLNTDRPLVNHIDMNLIDRDMDVKLYDWQKEFIKVYDIMKQKAHLNGELLSFGCGLGKTITSLALMKALGCDAVVIIAPKSTLIDVWVDHIERFYRDPQRIYLVNNTEPQDADFYIFNYESMDKVSQVMPFLRTKRKIGIIADESHNFLKTKSARTQNLITLRRSLNCHNALLMSGTPVKAMGAEVIPLLKVIDNYFDDEAEAIFKSAFGLNTALGTDILHSRMNLIMYRKKMEDVFKLPPKTEETVEIRIPNGAAFEIGLVKEELMRFAEGRKQYHAAKMPLYIQEWKNSMAFMNSSPVISIDNGLPRYKKVISMLKSRGYDNQDPNCVREVAWANEYEKKFLIPNMPREIKLQFNECKSAIKYLTMKIQGEVLGRLEKIRGKMITSMLNGIDLEGLIDKSDKKVIFFTSYVDTVETLDEILHEHGYNTILVYGKTSNQATKLLDKFRKDDSVKVLIATMQTLATGVTLTEANTVVFCNDPWRSADKEQASNRIWRIGQDSPCFIYTLHLDTGRVANLSDRTADILDWSKQMTESIIDGSLDSSSANFSKSNKQQDVEGKLKTIAHIVAAQAESDAAKFGNWNYTCDTHLHDLEFILKRVSPGYYRGYDIKGEHVICAVDWIKKHFNEGIRYKADPEGGVYYFEVLTNKGWKQVSFHTAWWEAPQNVKGCRDIAWTGILGESRENCLFFIKQFPGIMKYLNDKSFMGY